MPYPDNFDGTAFDRRYGTEADDDARAVAEACAAPHLANLARLRAAAKALVDLIDGAALPLEPGRGYDLQDVRAAAADLARADVTEFWARLVERRRGGRLMPALLTNWTDADGYYAVSVEPDPDTGDVTIMGEFTELGHTDQLTIPAAAIPWLQRALGRVVA